MRFGFSMLMLVFSYVRIMLISAQRINILDAWNRHYDLVESDCPDCPALSCSGVLLRSAESKERLENRRKCGVSIIFHAERYWC